MVVKQSSLFTLSDASFNVLQSSGTRTECVAVAVAVAVAVVVVEESGVDVVVSPAIDGKDDDCAAPATKLDIDGNTHV